MIKYNLNNINDWNYGDDNIVKVYHHNSVRYQKIYSGSTATWIAKLTLNDGSVVDIEDDGTGELKRSMTSAYSATCISAEIMPVCTKIDRSFTQYRYLTGVTIPNSVTVLGENSFLGAGLTSITIPNSVTSIGNGCFAEMTSISSITIPDSVTSIGRVAFQDNTGIRYVHIPSGITSLENATFARCKNLSTIEMDPVVPPTLNGGSHFSNMTTYTIYVPCESVDAYKTAWSAYKSHIACHQ